MRMFADYFQVPNVRLVRQGEVDVQHLLTSSAVLITDYSSVAWDFSFLHRPVLFFQFDRRTVGRRAGPAHRLLDPAARTDRDHADSGSSPCSARWWTPTSPWRRRTVPGPQAFLTYRDQRNCARILRDGHAGLDATHRTGPGAQRDLGPAALVAVPPRRPLLRLDAPAVRARSLAAA